MNSFRLVSLLIASIVLIGCTRGDVGGERKAKKSTVRETDPISVALEDLRIASGVSSYREILRRLNPVLDKQTDLRLSDTQKAWLEKAGLGPDDFVEIDARTFRPLDAYHLAGSYLVRDVARMLEIVGLDPLEQAKCTLAWVDRRVLLHQHGQEGLPTEYVLRAGFGGAGDRATVLVAVLGQLRIPACVLAEPGATEPSLVAVLADKKAYLFDPRMGVPVPTADRKGVATWTQLRAQPEIGKFVDLSAAQIAKLEARLVVPLEALSPRMEYLERLLKGEEANVGSERIVLHVDVVQAERDLADAGLRPVGLWNPNAELGPLHALRRFLPAEEGGRDATSRLARFNADQVPSGHFYTQYAKLRLLGDPGLPSAIDRMKVSQLDKVTRELFDLYYLQPQEMLVRGKTEEMPRRLDRIRTLLEDAEPVDGNEDSALAHSAAEWRKRADDAYLAMVRDDPSAGEKVSRLWNEDSLDWLQRPSRELAVKAKEAQLLTRLILSAIRDPMTEQSNYLLAGLSQDKAERAEALVQNQRRLGKESKALQKNAVDAWKNARSGWTRYLDRGNLGPKTLSVQIEAARRLRASPEPGLAALERLQLEMHRYTSAHLQIARAQALLGGNPADLDTVLAELEPIAKSDGPLAKEVDAFREQLALLPPPVREPYRRRLDLLRRDFGPGGSFTWTLREIRDVQAK
jgi:hypothetical protein